MTHDGHKRRKRSPPPPARDPSPSAALRRNKTLEEEGKGGKRRGEMILESQGLPVELCPPPCNVWSLMLPKMFKRDAGNLQRDLHGPIIVLWHVGRKKQKQAARNPHASFKRDQGLGKKTAENNSEK